VDRGLDQIASNAFYNYFYNTGNIFECSQLSDNFVQIIAVHFINYCAVFRKFSSQANTLQNVFGPYRNVDFQANLVRSNPS
jgi:hypothetical protein